MKVIVIGAYGHIGSYLIPKLVRKEYDVIAVSRGKSVPYTLSSAWKKITHLTLDREKDPDFHSKIAAVAADVVIDLINFTAEDTQKMIHALSETRLSHYLYCSSIWAHGRAEKLPADPNDKKFPLDEYGRQKYKSEQLLKEAYLIDNFPATVIMPGQISGPGWKIINPQGNLDPTIFKKISRGETVTLPNLGMETLHHVHAEDVAQLFFDAVHHRQQALGESFHAVAEDSLTLYGCAKAAYRFFAQEPRIELLPWDQWCAQVGNQEYVDHSYYHLARSGHYSLKNAQKLLDFSPRYSATEVIEVSLQSYVDSDWVVWEK